MESGEDNMDIDTEAKDLLIEHWGDLKLRLRRTAEVTMFTQHLPLCVFSFSVSCMSIKTQPSYFALFSSTYQFFLGNINDNRTF